jgi:UDP-4-amino-4,6-dideoxy-N-acetyl-beta-L-altrosamine N-acetyltransferase
MIELREVRDDDVERLFQWRREPEVDRWMYELPPEQFEAHRRWYDGFKADPDRTGWIITVKAQPCGFLTLSGLTGSQKRAQWGWYIGEAKARGQGAGRAAQALGLDRAFSEFGLQKVWSEVLADNEIALKAQAAAGFRREGYLRRHAFKRDQFHDVVLLAILKEEWAARREAVNRDLAASGLIRQG